MVDLPYISIVGFILKVLKFTNLKGMIFRVSWLNKLAVRFPAFSRGNSSLPDNGQKRRMGRAEKADRWDGWTGQADGKRRARRMRADGGGRGSDLVKSHSSQRTCILVFTFTSSLMKYDKITKTCVLYLQSRRLQNIACIQLHKVFNETL